MQCVERLDVTSAAKAARRQAQIDPFVFEDAEVCEHEFRPVLAERAEEQQPKIGAKIRDTYAIRPLVVASTPGLEGPRVQMLRLQTMQERRLLLRLRDEAST